MTGCCVLFTMLILERKKISLSSHYLSSTAVPTSCSEDYILQSAVWLNNNTSSKSTWSPVTASLVSSSFIIYIPAIVHETLGDSTCMLQSLSHTHTSSSLNLIFTPCCISCLLLPTIRFLTLSFFLIERLAEGEFIKGVIENENAMRLIHYEPVKQ